MSITVIVIEQAGKYSFVYSGTPFTLGTRGVFSRATRNFVGPGRDVFGRGPSNEKPLSPGVNPVKLEQNGQQKRATSFQTRTQSLLMCFWGEGRLG